MREGSPLFVGVAAAVKVDKSKAAAAFRVQVRKDLRERAGPVLGDYMPRGLNTPVLVGDCFTFTVSISPESFSAVLLLSTLNSHLDLSELAAGKATAPSFWQRLAANALLHLRPIVHGDIVAPSSPKTSSSPKRRLCRDAHIIGFGQIDL